MAVEPTGYWTFFCNPAKWEVDEFLQTGEMYGSFSVTSWQRDWFSPGQLGVLRVGVDTRTKGQLDGRERLRPGIYAIMEVIGVAGEAESSSSKFWSTEEEREKKRYYVEVKYVKNLIHAPVLLDMLAEDDDKYVLNGFQATTMPLQRQTFDHILSLGQVTGLALEDMESVDSLEKLLALEEKYQHAVPKVTVRLSQQIERGHIAQVYKEVAGFQCQVCKALGESPYSFQKKDGNYYIETHHVMPVASKVKGSLGIHNLLAVCPNHHRQLHFGQVTLKAIHPNQFVYMIDGEEVHIPKISLSK